MSGAQVTDRKCGDCGLCCKVWDYSIFNKPAGVWCQHYAAFKGCTIYESRPLPCRAFRCTWLLNGEFGEEWRPDRAGFFMWSQAVPTGSRLVVEVDADRPSSWRREPYLTALRAIARRSEDRHVEVFVRVGKRFQMLFPEGMVDLGDYRPLAIESGYRQTPAGMTPFARYVEHNGEAIVGTE